MSDERAAQCPADNVKPPCATSVGHPSPITHHLSRLLLFALVLLAGGCAKMSSIGMTTLKSANLRDLQTQVLNHKPDLDQFRSRGPFTVSVQLDRELRVSGAERVTADLFLSASGERAP